MLAFFAQSSHVIADCVAGQYVDTGAGNACKPCPAGTSSVIGTNAFAPVVVRPACGCCRFGLTRMVCCVPDNACKPCPAGTSSVIGAPCFSSLWFPALEVDDCPCRFWVRRCRVCVSDSVVVRFVVGNACKPCPAGTSSVIGARISFHSSSGCLVSSKHRLPFWGRLRRRRSTPRFRSRHCYALHPIALHPICGFKEDACRLSLLAGFVCPSTGISSVFVFACSVCLAGATDLAACSCPAGSDGNGVTGCFGAYHCHCCSHRDTLSSGCSELLPLLTSPMESCFPPTRLSVLR